MSLFCVEARMLSVILCGALSGCASTPPPVDPSLLPPMQVRAIETRTYQGHDTKTALKTVMNVLQDEGFLIDYGNMDLGLLHAAKTIGETVDQVYSPLPAIVGFNGLSGKRNSGGIAVVEATANVSDFGDGIKIRVNFQQKLTTNWFGVSVTTATPIIDAKSYQEFFVKLERGLFIQQQGL